MKLRPQTVLEFFCVPLYTDYLSDLHRKFQIASSYDTDLKYQICTFCHCLFFSYVDNTHSHLNHPLRA